MREGGGRLFLSIESRLRLQCFRERNTQKSLFYDFIKYLKIFSKFFSLDSRLHVFSIPNHERQKKNNFTSLNFVISVSQNNTLSFKQM